VSHLWRPQPLIRIPAPFDHADWLYELKHDGFRALAFVERSTCRLVSRRGHEFSHWSELCDEIARSVGARRAVLDGEVVCLRPDGNADFNALLFRRDRPFFYSFDLLALNGKDLRGKPLAERKERLRDLMPSRESRSRLRYVDHVEGQGSRLYEAVCRADAEGIVAKWKRGRYHADGVTTSWVKVKNSAYTQMIGRHELFADRRAGERTAAGKPVYRLDVAASMGRSA
jgi:bifunctional non-homologous end joining protein LigD